MLGRVKWKCFVSSQQESECSGMVHTRSAHLTLESSQSLFVLVYSAVEGKVRLSQMAQLLLPDQSFLWIRGHLCLTYSNKDSALLTLFGQDPSYIISLRGWPQHHQGNAAFSKGCWLLLSRFIGQTLSSIRIQKATLPIFSLIFIWIRDIMWNPVLFLSVFSVSLECSFRISCFSWNQWHHWFQEDLQTVYPSPFFSNSRWASAMFDLRGILMFWRAKNPSLLKTTQY